MLEAITKNYNNDCYIIMYEIRILYYSCCGNSHGLKVIFYLLDCFRLVYFTVNFLPAMYISLLFLSY